MTAHHPLTSAPIFPTICRLSVPNMFAMLATALVSIAETSYVGNLGLISLAGMALVFPLIMLQQMLSAGSMGGASHRPSAGPLARATRPRPMPWCGTPSSSVWCWACF